MGPALAIALVLSSHLHFHVGAKPSSINRRPAALPFRRDGGDRHGPRSLNSDRFRLVAPCFGPAVVLAAAACAPPKACALAVFHHPNLLEELSR